MPDVLPFAAITDTALSLVGGKGLSLALTAKAGLPVPSGFVVTTEAYLRAKGQSADDQLRLAVSDAYSAIGGGPVAVRSSATAEDGAETSFAGQQETILGVEGADAVVAAVERCWKSLFTERAVAYRAAQGVADDGLAMAVVVQKLVPATVAGVLFTRDPQDPTGQRMSVEAAWGLGEAVVSGRVTPDRFTVGFETGEVLSRQPGMKAIEITAAGERPVPEEKQTALCLTDSELSQLADLGRRVERFYGSPRDVEWAIAGGTVHLLQARPITASATDRDRVRRDVIAATAALAEPKGTVWVRYNLSETLPEPTPMTWAVVSRMLAGNGAFGLLNADLGGDPDPTLGDLGAFDLIAGRPMANLSRMPRLQFKRPPVEYPFAAMKADPKKALDPKPVLNPAKDGVLSALVRLPALTWRLFRISSATRKEADTFAARFTTQTAPAFATAAKAALATDWKALDTAVVHTAFNTWVEKTCVEFARDSLKPTAFAEYVWGQLVEVLKGKLGEEKAKAAVAEIALGAKPPAEAALADAVRDLSLGRITREAFVEGFGHRGRHEMELSQPRWAEDPEAVDALAGAKPDAISERFTELEQKLEGLAPLQGDVAWERIAREVQLTGANRALLEKAVRLLRTHLGLREAAKHYLLLGFVVLRRLLLELDSRFKLNGGVFFLLPNELPDLIAGKDLSAVIAQRKKRRQTELTLELPPVLFSDDLEAIGRPLPTPEGAESFHGTALSAGVAEAPALVLLQPTAPPSEPFVLVCPSTDPAWVPLFAKAKAVVMETGGVLSHGAIVAREFGLPAVAGLPDVTRRIRTGQRVRVDGGRGVVAILGEPPV
jgi:phosphohistidine swiveling domain-containing protein